MSMYGVFPNQYAKTAWVNDLHSTDGMEKWASMGQSFLRQRLYERSLTDKLIVPRQVDPNRIHSGIFSDQDTIPSSADGQVTAAGMGETFYTYEEIEPTAEAMALNYRGQADARYVQGQKYWIPLGQWSSHRLQKTEEELKATNFNLLKTLDTINARQIDEQRDRLFMGLLHQAVAKTGKSFGKAGPLVKGDLADLTIPIFKDHLRPYAFLLSDACFQDVLRWQSTDLDSYTGEVTVGGYKYTTLLGYVFVRSIKTELFDTYKANGMLNQSIIYCITTPDALGCNLVWDQPRMFSQWEGNLFTWWTWMNGGMGLGNIRGISRLVLDRD